MHANNRPRKIEEENSWIDAAQQGDKAAFTHLYHRYYSQVLAFCTRMLHGRPDIEDAAQQVFLEAWRSLCRFERRSLFSTWITKIAIHTCLSYYRKGGRFLVANAAEYDSSKSHSSTGWFPENLMPDEQLWLSSRKKAVINTLHGMTKKKQIVLILSDMQGMTAPEISGILGIPDATVRTRLFHARREFMNSLEQHSGYQDLFKEEISQATKGVQAH